MVYGYYSTKTTYYTALDKELNFHSIDCAPNAVGKCIELLIKSIWVPVVHNNHAMFELIVV